MICNRSNCKITQLYGLLLIVQALYEPGPLRHVMTAVFMSRGTSWPMLATKLLGGKFPEGKLPEGKFSSAFTDVVLEITAIFYRCLNRMNIESYGSARALSESPHAFSDAFARSFWFPASSRRDVFACLAQDVPVRDFVECLSIDQIKLSSAPPLLAEFEKLLDRDRPSPTLFSGNPSQNLRKEIFNNLPAKLQAQVLHEYLPDCPSTWTLAMAAFLAQSPMWIWQWIRDPTRPMLMPEHYPVLIHSIHRLAELAQIEDDVDPADATLDFFMQPDLISGMLRLERREPLLRALREFCECGPALLAVLDCLAKALPTVGVSEATRLITILGAIADLDGTVGRPANGARQHFARNFADITAGPALATVLRFRTCSSVLAAFANLFIQIASPADALAEQMVVATEVVMFMLGSPDEALVPSALKLTAKLGDGNQNDLAQSLSTAFTRACHRGEEAITEFLTLYPRIARNPALEDRLLKCLEKELQQLPSPSVPAHRLKFIAPLFSALTRDLEPPTRRLPFDEGPKSPFWIVYDKFHDKIKNIITKAPALLRTTFPFLKQFPHLTEFSLRQCIFQQQNQSRIKGATKCLRIHRSRILFESQRFFDDSRDAWLLPLNIAFIDEDGLDMHGLLKEWYTTIVDCLFDLGSGLFTSSLNHQSYYPRGDFRVAQPAYDTRIFEFAGRIVARAVTDEVNVPAHLIPSVLKRLLGCKLSLHDLEILDPEKYESLKAILESDDVEDWGLNFVTQLRDGEERIEGPRELELKPGGSHIPVTTANKQEYVDLEAEFHLIEHMRVPLQAFCDGFHAIIPLEELTWFTPDELDLLIYGEPKINVDELRASAILEYCKSTDPVVVMFWSVVKSMDPQLLRKLLIFVTASSQVPTGGFKNMSPRFKISMGKDNKRLPVAHTCFNQLDLQPYESEEQLKEKLLTAIHHGSQFALR
jgi:E3 ubiquitin-protein ligase HUWE1